MAEAVLLWCRVSVATVSAVSPWHTLVSFARIVRVRCSLDLWRCVERPLRARAALRAGPTGWCG